MARTSVRLNTARPSGLAFVKYRGDFDAVESKALPRNKPFASVQPRLNRSKRSTILAGEAAESGGAPPKMANAEFGTTRPALPNQSLNRSANGMSPGPVRGAVHSPRPGPGAIPSSPG